MQSVRFFYVKERIDPINLNSMMRNSEGSKSFSFIHLLQGASFFQVGCSTYLFNSQFVEMIFKKGKKL